MVACPEGRWSCTSSKTKLPLPENARLHAAAMTEDPEAMTFRACAGVKTRELSKRLDSSENAFEGSPILTHPAFVPRRCSGFVQLHFASVLPDLRVAQARDAFCWFLSQPSPGKFSTGVQIGTFSFSSPGALRDKPVAGGAHRCASLRARPAHCVAVQRGPVWLVIDWRGVAGCEAENTREECTWSTTSPETLGKHAPLYDLHRRAMCSMFP